ncbi:MAG: glycosyltransferase 87 family protein [Ignavibacteria bacterium]|nr:glycosyltransferase 87 family protein [Ignavibacteria bacterium]
MTIFLIFLLIEKKYWDIILTIAFLFICVFVLPYLFTGAKIFDYYSYYLENFIFNSLSVKTDNISEPMYFTLYGFINEIFVSSRSFGMYLQIVSTSLLLLPIVYLHYQLLKIDVSQRKLLLFSLLSLSILLISPSSQTHHLVFIIPSMFLIIINFYEKIDKDKRLFIFYYTLVFILFWLGNIFKHTPLVFLSLCTLFIIIILSKNINFSEEL